MTDTDAEPTVGQDASSVSALLEVEPSEVANASQRGANDVETAQVDQSGSVSHQPSAHTITARPAESNHVTEDEASQSLLELPGPILPPADQAKDLEPKPWAPRSSTPMGPHADSLPKPLPAGLGVLSQDSGANAQSVVSGSDALPAETSRAISAESEGRQHPASQLGLGLPGRISVHAESAGSASKQARPVPHTPSVRQASEEPNEAQTPTANQPTALNWRAMPGFEELSESWAAGAAADPIGPAEPSTPRPNPIPRHVHTQTPIGTPQEESVSMMSPDERPAGFRSSKPNQRFLRTDSGLRAGPTSPSMRVPSHSHAVGPGSSLTSADGTGATGVSASGSFRDALGASSFEPAPPAASQPALSRRPSSEGSETSTASGAKAGSKTLERVGADTSVISDGTAQEEEEADAGSPEESTARIPTRASVATESPAESSFGMAREPDVPEQTFVEHSNVGSLPPPLKPAWARAGKGAKGVDRAGGDMFTPLKLQSMWRTPTPEPRPSGSTDQLAEAGPSRQTSASPSIRPAAALEQNRSAESNDTASASAQAPAADAPAQVRRIAPDSTPRPPSARFTFKSPEEVVAPDFHQPQTPFTPRHRQGTLHVTPGIRATPRTPRVPRTPNVPLRIFRTGRTPPYSARPAPSSTRPDRQLARSYNGRAAEQDSPREASRLAADAAERRRKERDQKRLRLLAPPSPGSSEGSDASATEQEHVERQEVPAFKPRFSTAEPEEEELIHISGSAEGELKPSRRDYAQEGTEFLARLQNVRLASEATSRSMSGESATDAMVPDTDVGWTDEDEQGDAAARIPRRSSIRSMSGSTYASLRAGAQAPTPRHGVYNGSPLRISQKRIPSAPSSTSLVGRSGRVDESPRRMLRRFSAIDRAYQEYEAESMERSFEAAERLRREEEDERRADEEFRRLEAKKHARGLAGVRGRPSDPQAPPTDASDASAGMLDASLQAHKEEVFSAGSTNEPSKASRASVVGAPRLDSLTPVDSADPTLIRKSSLVHIGPEALPSNIDELGGGRMIFDAASQKWIKKSSGGLQDPIVKSEGRLIAGLPSSAHIGKSRQNAESFHPTAEIERNALGSASAAMSGVDSTDPFRDIESFGTSDEPSRANLAEQASSSARPNSSSFEVNSSRIDSAATPRDSSGAALKKPVHLASSSRRRGGFARRSAAASAVARSRSALRNEIDLFSDGDSTQRSHSSTALDLGSDRSHAAYSGSNPALRGPSHSQDRQSALDALMGSPATPPGKSAAQRTSSTPQRSPTHRAQVPRSILKARTGIVDTPERQLARPDARSISFADTPDREQTLSSESVRNKPSSVDPRQSSGDMSRASAERQNHLEEVLRQIVDLALGAENESRHYPSPASRTRAFADETEADAWQDVTPTRTAPNAFQHDSASLASGGRSPWNITALRQRRGRGDDDGEMSFLTNASFAMAHDRIVELIVDVAPWHEGWKDMLEIDLSGRRVESVVRLKEHLPSLQIAHLHHNELSYLTGLPENLRELHASHNSIPPTISFSHLPLLTVLDISHNAIGSLAALSGLIHLRDLRADATGVDSIEGIEHLEGLKVLSLRQNALSTLNLLEVKWRKLEKLNLRHNGLRSVRGLATNDRLRSLDLCHNQLSYLELGGQMSHLRALKVSHNAALEDLDVSLAPNLRALYADGCALHRVQGLASLTKLDELSLRQQLARKGLLWPADEVPDIRRLHLSGNAFPEGIQSNVQLLNLVFLELAGCQLTSVPPDLPKRAPNMRHLNLDHNLLSKLPALQAMRRLKRLSLVGCRIKRPTSLIDALAGMSELSVLDLRLNPCTLGLYPPLLLSSATPVISDEATHERSRRPPASMPPFPDPGVVQPDRAAAVLREAKRAERAAQQQIEKSVFHKRQPGPDLDAPRGKRWSDDEQGETEVSQGLSTISSKHDVGLDAQQKMMAAADARFAQTLPPTFAYRRLMHRGSLAMACPALAWLDGLLVDEAEVVKADELLSASPPFASGAFLSSSPHT